MRLDLSEIAGHPGMHASVELREDCPVDVGFSCAKEITGHLELSNTGTLMLINGSLSTEVVIPCGRCLADFTMPVDMPVEEEFRLLKVGDAIQVLPIEEKDIEENLVSHNILDMQELVRESLLVALPIQPLCKPECAGLCPTCGENLNLRKCQCPPIENESPFKALGRLLQDKNKEK